MPYSIYKPGLLLVILVHVINFVSSITCPNGMIYSAGICYKYHPVSKTWSDANTFCKTTYGGSLVVINNANVFNLLTNLMKNTPGLKLIWLGASDSNHDNTFVWNNGLQCCPNRWAPRQPDGSGHCLDMWQTSSGNIGFDDGACSASFNFVCQAAECHDIPHCLPGQTTCTGPSDSGHQCTNCDTGYFAAGLGQGCVACNNLPHCLPGHVTCTGPAQSNHQCTQCDVEYFNAGLGKGCVACNNISYCLPGHVVCTGPAQSQHQCSQCDVGYFADGLGKGCLGCRQIDNCLVYECTNASMSVCTKCSEGMSAISNGLVCYDTNNLSVRLTIGDHTYFVYDDNSPVTWHTAEDICKFNGGNLLVPETSNMERELRYQLQSTFSSYTDYKFWLGGRLVNVTTSIWIGTTQNNVFTRWGHRPAYVTTELCIAMDQSNEYKLTALPCLQRHAFICQKKSIQQPTVG